MIIKKFLSLVILIFSLLMGLSACASSQISYSGDITIGSKNFTENIILAEILAKSIETKTNLKVTRKFNLGGTGICHEGVKSGQLDAYVEYTGTAFTAILKQKKLNDAQAVYDQVKQEYIKQFNLVLTEPLGFEDTFAIIIRKKDAQRLHIQTISEVAKYISQWQGGFGYEFTEREDGLQGLSETYGLEFTRSPQIMELGLLYRALVEKKVDIIAGNSTDGQIATLGLVILKDDKQYFPPYQAVPIVRQETLQKYPQLREVFQQLGGKITESEMQRMNYKIDGDFDQVEDVAENFLRSKKLLNK